jgi:hypothetical protein
MNLIQVANLQQVPAATPKATEAAGAVYLFQIHVAKYIGFNARAPMKPAPDVIATRPAMAPEQKAAADHVFFLSM